MNNIEILEEFVKEYKDKGYFGIIKAEQLQIVENLIQENKELKDSNKKLYELCQGNAMQEFINNECGFIPKSQIEDVINSSVSSYECLKENLETLLYGEDCHR